MSDAAKGRSHPAALRSDHESKTLIVTGTNEDLDLVRHLAAELDVPERDPLEQVDRRRTSFQYVVYELDLPPDRIAVLRVDELTAQAETAYSLKAALEEFGGVRTLYRAEQIVQLGQASKKKTVFTTGSKTPFVRNMTIGERGNVNSQVEYEDVGCIVRIEGDWDAPSGGFARIEMELSSLTDSTVNLGNDVKAPIFHNIVQQFDGPITSGEPIVLLTIDGSGEKETATAYITRIRFDQR